MTKVMIVWQDVPERTAIYLLDFDSEQSYRRCLTCHGHLLNSVNDEEIDENLNELSELLEHVPAEKVLYDSDAKNNPVRSVNAEYAIVVTGIIL